MTAFTQEHKFSGPVGRLLAGACLLCAVDRAIGCGDERVVGRVGEALGRFCGLRSGAPVSIPLAAGEAGGDARETAWGGCESRFRALRAGSVLMTGHPGRPVDLAAHSGSIQRACGLRAGVAGLSYSLWGIWEADLLLGRAGSGRWVAAAVDPDGERLGRLAKGTAVRMLLTAGSERPYINRERGVVVCPVGCDERFTRLLHEARVLLRASLAASTAGACEEGHAR